MNYRKFLNLGPMIPVSLSHKESILLALKYLHKRITEIDSYHDESLFFQNPQIIELWITLVRELNKIETVVEPRNNQKWEKRTDTYVASLLPLREIYEEYQTLYKLYYNPLKELLDGYGGWLEGECLRKDSIDALIEEQYQQDLNDVEDLNQYLEELNNKSLKARFNVFSTLSDVFNILMAVMNRGGQIVIDKNPSDDVFVEAIDNDLREWTHSFGKDMFEDMKEDLNRNFKPYRTAPNTPKLWGELLSADENALKMAISQELTTCEDAKQEHWGEDMKKQMEDNVELICLLYSSFKTEKLFDLRNVDNVQKFISLLKSDNLDLFYEIIVRRNIIQCEMYSELKAQHEDWLNPTNDDETGNNEIPQMQADSEEDENNEETPEEERFHYIHVEIEDEEAWRIHRAIKRLVANFRIPDICNYLKEQQKNGKLMLPSDSSAMYNELVRLGMPTGKGFSEKNFSNSYTK